MFADDDNFRAAKRLVDSGALGDIHAVETSSQDKQDETGVLACDIRFEFTKCPQVSSSLFPCSQAVFLLTWVCTTFVNISRFVILY